MRVTAPMGVLLFVYFATLTAAKGDKWEKHQFHFHLVPIDPPPVRFNLEPSPGIKKHKPRKKKNYQRLRRSIAPPSMGALPSRPVDKNIRDKSPIAGGQVAPITGTTTEDDDRNKSPVAGGQVAPITGTTTEDDDRNKSPVAGGPVAPVTGVTTKDEDRNKSPVVGKTKDGEIGKGQAVSTKDEEETADTQYEEFSGSSTGSSFQAGTIVGICVGVAGLVALIAFFIKRNRRSEDNRDMTGDFSFEPPVINPKS